MTKVSLHKFLKNSYKKNKQKDEILDGYKLDKKLSNHNNQVYFNPGNKKLIFTVTGTHNAKDWVTDIYLAAGKLKDTERYKSAHKTLRAAKTKYDVDEATVAGHSLGGTIAGYIGGENDRVVTLDKGATVGQRIRKNEHAYRIEGDAVSSLNALHPRMTTLKNHSTAATATRSLRGGIYHMFHTAKKAHDVDQIKHYHHINI